MADLKVADLTPKAVPELADYILIVNSDTGDADALISIAALKSMLFQDSNFTGTTFFDAVYMTGLARMGSSGASHAGFRLGYDGADPTSPVNGDFWLQSSGPKIRFNGETFMLATTKPKGSDITGGTVTLVHGQDYLDITATSALTMAAPSGTPVGKMFGVLMRIKDNGTSRSISWNAIWRGIGLVLPTATVAGKELYIGAVWNAGATKMDVLSVGQET